MDPEHSNEPNTGIASEPPSRRFRVARDDVLAGSFTFDVLECRQGDLRLVEPSRRGYERYYITLALMVALFLFPFAFGLLPWQVLWRGGAEGLPMATRGWGLLYAIATLATIVAWSVYAFRLAGVHPRATLKVKVLEAHFAKNPRIDPRIRVQAGDETFWLVVQSKEKDLRSGLSFAGQTDWTPSDNY